MKKDLTILMVSAVTLLFAATFVYAGAGTMACKASELMGRQVQNQQGEQLGEITDLAVDTQSGRITFAVLSHGGVMGMGENLIAVPVAAMSFSEDKVVLNISKDKLASAPTLNQEKWVEMTNRQQIENTYRFFGISPYWEERGGMQMEKQQKQEKSKSY